ncbi:MAG: NTP transferase domain-containing protein [Candidatus Latescibacterota bacterium]|nr:MAG: NTP transferase domain-containing protein [Candidatus Latescibacterota bacterium]
MKRAAVILAAGKGTRMPADKPKVMHEIEGKPMVIHVIDAIRGVFGSDIYVVVGYMAEQVVAACHNEDVEFVYQREQLGTGHAVLQCEDALRDITGTVAVLNGDVPCLRTRTIEGFLDYHDSEAAAATVLTAVLENPTGYGRIVRAPDDSLLKIVEQKDATSAEKKICEINSGLFCFDKSPLFDALKSTDRDNAQNEYYLTDVIGVLKSRGEPVRAYCVADPREVSGVNTEEELAAVRSYFEGLKR